MTEGLGETETSVYKSLLKMFGLILFKFKKKASHRFHNNKKRKQTKKQRITEIKNNQFQSWTENNHIYMYYIITYNT